MKLIETFDQFSQIDTSKRHCRTYGVLKKNNRAVSLGDPPSIGFGERLLGKYKVFFQFSTQWTRQEFVFDATSSVGELKFHITLEVSFRVDPDHAEDVYHDGFDFEEDLQRPLISFCRRQAKTFHADDYKTVEGALEAQLQVDAKGIGENAKVQIKAIEVSVSRDDKISDGDELRLIVGSLQQRLLMATHDGNAKTATLLKNTLDVLNQFQSDKHRETLNVAERAKELQDAINVLLDGGMDPKDAVIDSLRTQRTNLVRAAERSYAGNTVIGQQEKPVDQLGPASDNDDPEDRD